MYLSVKIINFPFFFIVSVNVEMPIWQVFLEGQNTYHYQRSIMIHGLYLSLLPVLTTMTNVFTSPQHTWGHPTFQSFIVVDRCICLVYAENKMDVSDMMGSRCVKGSLRTAEQPQCRLVFDV